MGPQIRGRGRESESGRVRESDRFVYVEVLHHLFDSKLIITAAEAVIVLATTTTSQLSYSASSILLDQCSQISSQDDEAREREREGEAKQSSWRR